MSTPVLRLRGITKRFPGVLALDDVSIEVRPHEVVGLIGENGAGKSTLLKILSGVYQPDGGELLVRGEPAKFRGPRDAARAGIGMVHQEQSLIGSVTVAENILLGAEGGSVRAGVYRWTDLNRRAQAQLDKIGSRIKPAAATGSLTFAQRQMVEVAKALAVEEQADHEPVIVLDEPTSVLEGEDLETLFAQVHRLRQIASVIFVSHRLDEVLRVSDRVYVMKDGRCVAERDPKRVDVDELYRLMVGRESAGQYFREGDQQSVDGAEPLLTVENLTRAAGYRDVTFTVRAGEVLGVAGVIGSGREDLCRTLFGAEPHESGMITLGGRRTRFRSPADAVRAGMGYIPSERRVEGVAMGMSVRENILLADPRPASAGPFLRPRRERHIVRDWIDRLRIRTPTLDTDVGKLSGGNQQKVALAKWLVSPRLRVLILDHPTRGLDVGAKEDVYRFIREICARGVGVVLLADTLEETIALSHNVIVMRDGRISARFSAAPGEKPSQVELVEQMV
jgi:ribose transport system ATP-binding protein